MITSIKNEDRFGDCDYIDYYEIYLELFGIIILIRNFTF